MRRLTPVETSALEDHSPIVWSSHGEDPGLVFDIDPAGGAFICFFLSAATAELAPRITFDEGGGFNDLTALTLKSFPFAFYHVSLARMRDMRRLRFRPCKSPGLFKFVAFQTSSAILVAVLHFLFNLRYQNIGLVAPDAKGRPGRIQAIKSNVARIAKFFGDVSKGGGVRVQEGSLEMLPILKLAMSLKAVDVQDRMARTFKDAGAPLISFVAPTYNTRPDYLTDLLDSFALQRAPYAELILSDDGSTASATLAALETAKTRPGVVVMRDAANKGIASATNAGIAAARGRWIAFIDHDDAFVPGAVAIIADAVHRHPDALFFYTDEIIVDGALKPIGHFCKPAYDSVLLTGANYINHFSIFRADRLARIGRLRMDREGSQDYDLVLRYLTDAPIGSIIHIPYLAYMWRREALTYSTVNLDRSVTSARSALHDAFKAKALPVRIEPALDPGFHRVRFPARIAPTPVSVIVPNRDSPALIKSVVSDLLDKTSYAVQILIVDNGTKDQETLAFYESMRRRSDVIIDIVEEPFNFAAMCNRGACLATGNAFLFLNNDIEVLEPGWLSEMVECLDFDATGIVGAKLAYPSGRVQHNGVIVGLGSAAGHWYIEAEPDEPGPMGRFLVRQTLGAVTGACMLVTRICFETLGGFDAVNFKIAYNDVDLCIRARNAGFRTVWTPFAKLIHHESVTRGSDETGQENVRFRQEFARLQAIHGTDTLIDDAFSPFYDRKESRPTLFVPDGLPALRPNVLR